MNSGITMQSGVLNTIFYILSSHFKCKLDELQAEGNGLINEYYEKKGRERQRKKLRKREIEWDSEEEMVKDGRR